jgi:hypothetical protein
VTCIPLKTTNTETPYSLRRSAIRHPGLNRATGAHPPWFCSKAGSKKPAAAAVGTREARALRQHVRGYNQSSTLLPSVELERDFYRWIVTEPSCAARRGDGGELFVGKIDLWHLAKLTGAPDKDRRHYTPREVLARKRCQAIASCCP